MSGYVTSELTVSLGVTYCSVEVVVVVSSAVSLPQEATEKNNAHTNNIAIINLNYFIFISSSKVYIGIIANKRGGFKDKVKLNIVV